MTLDKLGSFTRVLLKPTILFTPGVFTPEGIFFGTPGIIPIMLLVNLG